MLTAISETRRPTGSKSKGINTTKRKLTKINPHGQFVIKTKTFTPYGSSPPGTKLFINVCMNDNVPLPPALKPGLVEPQDDIFDASVVFPLIMENKWEIPILTSPELRDDKDKKGQHSLVIDCVVHSKPMKWCLVNADLKMILIEWCFDAVEFKIGGENGDFLIDRDTIAFPKRTYMGEVVEMEVDLEGLKEETEELSQLSERITKGDDGPGSILQAKRAVEEDTTLSLSGLIGTGNTSDSSTKRPLIEEIDTTTQQKKKIEELPSKPSSKPAEKIISNSKTKVNFTTVFMKLDPNETSGNYKALLKVSSVLKDSKMYKVGYFKDTHSIHIEPSDREKYDISKSVVKFPLSTELQGDLGRVFYVTSENQLYIYLK